MDSITSRVAQDKLEPRVKSGIEAQIESTCKDLDLYNEGIGQVKEPTEADIANNRAMVEAKIAAYNSENLSAQSALKTGLLINAGALITLLTFISRVWSQNIEISQVLNSLLVFAFGVFCGGVGVCCNYLMHRSLNTHKTKRVKLIKFALASSLAFALISFLLGTVLVYIGLSGVLNP